MAMSHAPAILYGYEPTHLGLSGLTVRRPDDPAKHQPVDKPAPRVNPVRQAGNHGIVRTQVLKWGDRGGSDSWRRCSSNAVSSASGQTRVPSTPVTRGHA